MSTLKNEKAIEALADMMDPIIEIFSDQELKNIYAKGDRVGSIKYALKNHSRSVLTILAIMDGVDVDEYECNMMTLPAKIINLLNDPDIATLFQLQDQKEEPIYSGPAMGSTQG